MSDSVAPNTGTGFFDEVGGGWVVCGYYGCGLWCMGTK